MAATGTFNQRPIFEAAKTGNVGDVKTATRRYVQQKEKEKILNSKDKDGRTPLHVACLYNNTAVIMHLVEYGFDYDALDKFRASPLMYAVRQGFVPLLDHVINLTKKGEEEDDLDEDAEKARKALLRSDITLDTLLHYCFGAGADYLEQASKKQSTRKRHSSGTSSTNSKEKKQEIVRKLCEAGLSLNRADAQSRAVLNYALINKHHDCVPFLLSKEACISDVVSREVSILHWKIYYPKDENEKLDEFLAFCNIDKRESNGRTALHCAANLSEPKTKTCVDGNADEKEELFYKNESRKQFRLSCAEFLISKNCSINAVDFIGMTPLQLALINGFEEMVELLLSKGGRLRGTTGNFTGILHYESCVLWTSTTETEIRSKHKYYVERYKVNVDELDDSKRTALHYTCFSDVLGVDSFASNKGRICGVEALLALGANIDATDDQGYTPLMYAVRNKSLDVVSLLIEKGANTQIKNKVSLTAFNFAEGCGDRATQFLNVLKGSGEDIRKDNIFELCSNSLSRVASVLEKDDILPEFKRTTCLKSVKQAKEAVSNLLQDSELRRRIKIQREILENNRQMLCEEMMPKYLFAKLRQEKVLTEDLEEEIRTLQMRRRQVERLLDILPRTKPDALEVLIEALRTESPWLADLLQEDYEKKLRNTPYIE